MNLDTKLEIGERVNIDGDTSLAATVIAFLWRKNYFDIEISWVHNGDLKSAWIAEWRLQKAI